MKKKITRIETATSSKRGMKNLSLEIQISDHQADTREKEIQDPNMVLILIKDHAASTKPNELHSPKDMLETLIAIIRREGQHQPKKALRNVEWCQSSTPLDIHSLKL